VHNATRFIVLLVFLLQAFILVIAQKKQEDTTSVKRLNPRKATIYSAVCPGLGQIYNGKIWKTGIIYAGFAGITAGFLFNQKEYKSYQNAINVRFDSLSSTVDNKYPTLTDGTVQGLRNYHRRNRDICILAYIGLYTLNIIDANVDANLQEFKINKDLSLNWHPSFYYSVFSGASTGLNLTLNF